MQADPRATVELSQARQALLQKYLRGAAQRRDMAPATIPKRSDNGPAPLSYSQQQIWLHSQLAGSSLIYNEPITIHRRGPLNIAALERAFTEVVRRHEAWRTTFEWRGDSGVQIVKPPPPQLAIPFHDLRADAEPAAEAIRLATEDARQPFDLARGPMYRLRLVRLSDDEYRLFLTLHHIIFDGVSLYQVLLPELLGLYEAFAKNETAPFDELPIQYPDFAAWQRDTVREIAPEDLIFWQEALHELPALDLKTNHRRLTQTYAGAMETFQVPAETAAALKKLSEEQGTTLFITMVAAFVALLHGYTEQEDIVVGGVSSGRHHAETQKLLGCFLNTIPIRCAFAKDAPFTDLLSRARSATLGALSHDTVPFELLVQQFARQRDPGRAPLAQVLIVVEPPLEPLPAGWDFTHLDVETGTAKFDLQLGLDDRAEGLAGSFIYNTELFERETIALLKKRWLKLLQQIAVTPSQSVARLTSLAWRQAGEAQMPPPEWSGMRTSYPCDTPIHRLFEEQVESRPDATALVLNDKQLSYEQLNRRANRMARRLQQLGVARDVPVGVWMERSFDMIVALLAILKAGGAYLPLDPSYPAERLGLMITDAQTPVILTSKERRNDVAAKASTAQVICVDEQEPGADNANLSHTGKATDLAYIMYTSGSTGIPKGVAVPHRAIVRLVRETNYASFSPDETFLQLAPISFDAATFEIWGPLLNGGRLVLMPPEPPTLVEIGRAIARHGVTTLWLTSGLFNAMVDERLDDLRPLSQLLAGGDVLSLAHVGKALAALKSTRLINGYGPTESTTFACCHTIERNAPLDTPVPIGKPIANTTVQIVDERLAPVPVGRGGGTMHRGRRSRAGLLAAK